MCRYSAGAWREAWGGRGAVRFTWKRTGLANTRREGELGTDSGVGANVTRTTLIAFAGAADATR